MPWRMTAVLFVGDFFQSFRGVYGIIEEFRDCCGVTYGGSMQAEITILIYWSMNGGECGRKHRLRYQRAEFDTL